MSSTKRREKFVECFFIKFLKENRFTVLFVLPLFSGHWTHHGPKQLPLYKSPHSDSCNWPLSQHIYGQTLSGLLSAGCVVRQNRM